MSFFFCIVVMVFLVFKRFVLFVKNLVYGWFGYEFDKLRIVKIEYDWIKSFRSFVFIF